MPQPDSHSDFAVATQYARRVVNRIGRAPIALLWIWFYAVYWGEQSSFGSHVQSCTWDKWETWKAASRPHRVLLIADPQIVDPHTYPDRPWPLSSLTILYTDLYLKRAYRDLLRRLQPDSTVFLGDLFDGGREWGTSGYKSPDDMYKSYGQDFWLSEYERFNNMFLQPWHDSGLPYLPNEGGRRFIASIAGNHDLGFGGGINKNVKDRFDVHFGPLNRMDVIGNHTLIHLDTVSLSAMDQVDAETGAAGMGDGSAAATKSSKIWQPVERYLKDAKHHREQVVKNEIRTLGEQSAYPELRDIAAKSRQKFTHQVHDLEGPEKNTEKPKSHSWTVATSQFPSIILSHVPFYRNDDTDCGPNREKGRAIPISAGYQYQNVLTPLISKDIVEKLDASQIAMIYSGDDHDYCEVDHDRFTGRIKEITVKSMSWAMGIRKPGVQLVSLWNPIDLSSAMIPSSNEQITSMPKNTVQNHMCLLPDQLGIFITYGELLALTLIILLIRALTWRRHSPSSSHTTKLDFDHDHPLLPFTHSDADSTTSTLHPSHITSRKPGLPASSYGNIPLTSRSRSTSPSKAKQRAPQTSQFSADSDEWGMPTTASDRVAYAHRHHDPAYMTPPQRFVYNMCNSWIVRAPRSKVGVFLRSAVFVAVPTLALYSWLLWRDM